MIHFKFVGIKDMHNIYYLGLSGERSLPFGLLVLIILNIVQNLDLHLLGPFIHGLHPQYPTSTTYPKPCYPLSPIPPLIRPPPARPPPPPQFFFFFFELSQKLHFSVHIHPDPPPTKASLPCSLPPPPRT